MACAVAVPRIYMVQKKSELRFWSSLVCFEPCTHSAVGYFVKWHRREVEVSSSRALTVLHLPLNTWRRGWDIPFGNRAPSGLMMWYWVIYDFLCRSVNIEVDGKLINVKCRSVSRVDFHNTCRSWYCSFRVLQY